MNREELSRNDGQDGRRAYVAVNGIIYDLTDSPLWQNGLHPPDHKAGGDLTDELRSAPHVRAVVERFPVIGRLDEEAPTQSRSGGGRLFAIIAVLVLLVVIGLAFLL